MRAAIYRSFGGPIRVEDVPIPSKPPDDGVIVQVMATGVCRSDWHGWKGHDSDIINHGLPFSPGHELSGTIYKVGRKVQTFRVGDPVVVPFILSCGACSYCQHDQSTVCTAQEQPGFTRWGSFAEYVALPRADRNLRKIPPQVSFVQAAALGCRFTTAYRAILQQGRLRELMQQRQRRKHPATIYVAVFGCGGLGLSCIMIAAAEKEATIVQQQGQTAIIIDIIAVDVSPQALKKAKELGATHTIQAMKKSAESKKDTNEDVRQQVLDITKGHGADISIDAAGFAATCENAVVCTKRGGRMVQVGLPIGEKQPKIPMGLVAGRELELVGSHGFAAADLPDLLQLVVDKKLDPSLLVEKEVTLEEGAKAIEDMDKESPLGITVVTKFQRENNSKL